MPISSLLVLMICHGPTNLSPKLAIHSGFTGHIAQIKSRELISTLPVVTVQSSEQIVVMNEAEGFELVVDLKRNLTGHLTYNAITTPVVCESQISIPDTDTLSGSHPSEKNKHQSEQERCCLRPRGLLHHRLAQAQLAPCPKRSAFRDS